MFFFLISQDVINKQMTWRALDSHILIARIVDHLYARMLGFATNWVRLAQKWDKSGEFFRSDSVHFGSESQNVLNLI